MPLNGIRLHHHPDAGRDSERYTVTPHSEGRLAAVTAIRLWSEPASLVRYAIAGHGYFSGNSYSGITYPGDLDEHELANRDPIPDGYVEATAGLASGTPGDHLIPRSEYLELLRQYLVLADEPGLAEEVAQLLPSDQRHG